MLRVIEPRLGEVDVQHRIVGMPGEVCSRKVPVVVVRQLAGTGHSPPNIILQLGEGLPVVLGVVPGIPHDVLVDIEQAVPVPTFGELLHPLAPGGVDVLPVVALKYTSFISHMLFAPQSPPRYHILLKFLMILQLTARPPAPPKSPWPAPRVPCTILPLLLGAFHLPWNL